MMFDGFKTLIRKILSRLGKSVLQSRPGFFVVTSGRFFVTDILCAPHCVSGDLCLFEMGSISELFFS